MDALIGNTVRSGLPEKQMTEDVMKKAQDYLTITTGNQRKKIIDMERLCQFPVIFVIAFLKELLDCKKRILKEVMANKDKLDIEEIDKIIDSCYRLQMALDVIRKDMEKRFL